MASKMHEELAKLEKRTSGLRRRAAIRRQKSWDAMDLQVKPLEARAETLRRRIAEQDRKNRIGKFYKVRFRGTMTYFRVDSITIPEYGGPQYVGLAFGKTQAGVDGAFILNEKGNLPAPAVAVSTEMTQEEFEKALLKRLKPYLPKK